MTLSRHIYTFSPTLTA